MHSELKSHLSCKDFVIDNVLRPDRIRVTPVKVKLLQFILVAQRSSIHICWRKFQQNIVRSRPYSSAYLLLKFRYIICIAYV